MNILTVQDIKNILIGLGIDPNSLLLLNRLTFPKRHTALIRKTFGTRAIVAEILELDSAIDYDYDLFSARLTLLLEQLSMKLNRQRS